MATLTINHYINEADSFISDVRNDRNGYYIFASRPQPWANSTGGNDDTAVVATNTSVAQVEQNVYDDILYGKLLRDEDINHVIPRNNWVANTVYASYDQNDANLYNKAFYVVTDNSEVYKCIDNNGGSQSTVKPSLTSTAGVFKTGDGYVWKYMYTIDAASNNKFTTTDYIPVVPNTEVRNNALPGSLDVIKVTNGGNGYVVYETGYIGGVVVINDETPIANRIQLPLTSSNTSGYYVNSSIYLKTGFGAGQIREIIASNGTSKEITLKEAIQTFARLDLANVQGTITTGYYAEQPYDLIDMLYTQGYFNSNTTITQSDTGVSYTVLAANTSVIRGSRSIANAQFTTGASLPFVDTTTSGTLEPGTVSVGNVGACNVAIVVTPGSGYTANATVTISNTGPTGSGATANAQSNTSGKISVVNITNVGSGYFTAPTVTISDPANTTFDANSAVTGGTGSGSNNVIALSSANRFVINDQITYSVASGNTAIGGLTNGVTYLVEFANSTVVALKTSISGPRIALTKGASESGHALKGQTAVATIFCDNQIIRGSGTQLNDFAANGYANGEYIRVGANTTSNIRRVINTINTTALIVSTPFSSTFTATGRLTSIELSGATATGYNNNDIITVRSPIANSTNAARVTFTTNSTGGSLTFTIANAGFGFVLGQVPVSNITITNSTGGTAAGNTTTTFLVANCATANQHFKMTTASEVSALTQRRARGYISNTNLTSVRLSITNSSIVGRLFTVGERAVMTDSARSSQGANAVIAYSNTTTVILSSVSGTWLANSGGTQFFVSGESSQQLSQITDVTSNPNITISQPLGTFQLGYPITIKTTADGSVSGNATLVAKFVMPGDQTEYQIGPTVVITGDGSNAVAVAVVNNAANSRYEIIGIDVINPGTGYSEANVVIYANSNYGTGATANAVISPVRGHGFDPDVELGARYVGINTSFDNLSNENYKFLGYGQYRKIGIIQNPQFKDIRVTLTDFDRANFTLNAASYSSTLDWTPGEVVVQSSTNAAGVVVSGNTTFLQLKNVKGTFNESNTIYGYYSNTTANVITYSVIRFPVGNTNIITQSNTGATGTITSAVNATTYFMSNVVGQFADGDIMYDSVSNAYATVDTIFTANGTIDSSIDFGNKFNQTARITLTSSSGTFIDNEFVRQNVSLASGRVISSSQEKDLVVSMTSGSFSVGQTITDATTYANGICTFANSTYLKLTNVSQNSSFVAADTINNGLGSTATISEVLPVLVLSDVSDVNNFQAGANDIIGQTSDATGRCNNQILIRNPDLVRDSGSVIYLESFQPVTRSATSKEEIKLVIKF